MKNFSWYPQLAGRRFGKKIMYSALTAVRSYSDLLLIRHVVEESKYVPLK